MTVAVKIVEHSAETEGELLQLRESLLSSSIVHPNVVDFSTAERSSTCAQSHACQPL